MDPDAAGEAALGLRPLSDQLVPLPPTSTKNEWILMINELIKINNGYKALEKVYPVGAIHISATDSRNPGDIYGFGTWTAMAAGRVLVGKAASGTFATAGATGGEETHVLTIPEMPAHTHTIDAHYSNAITPRVAPFLGSGSNLGFNVSDTTSAGGGTAHNNLQPYVVVYMWQRTA